jgi:hypothetical protein
MSAAYNISWNTDIKNKCLSPKNKYSLKVLLVKYQISSAYVKSKIHDCNWDSSIFRIFTNFTSTASLLSGSSPSFHPVLEECNHDNCGQQCLVTADRASAAHIPHPLAGSQTKNIDRTYEGRLISNAHSEISRKRDHVFKQTKVGSKLQYCSYKLTYLFFDIVPLSFNTFFQT